MKKIILSILLIGTLLAAKSQNLSLGPVAGINHSWMTEAGNNKHFNPGLNIGGTLTYSFDPSWGVGADLLYSRGGVKNQTTSGGVTASHDVNLNFIRFQPKMIYFFGDLGDAVRPKLFAGSSFGLLTGGETKSTVASNNESMDLVEKIDAKDRYRAIDLGLLAGTGINWRIGKATWLNTDLVYNHGLVDLSKTNNTWSASRSVAFNIGVTFPIGTVTP